MGEGDEGRVVVVGTGIEVATLEDNDGGAGGVGGERGLEGFWREVDVVVEGEFFDVIGAETEEVDGAINGAVTVGGEDAGRRGAGETVGFEVDAVLEIDVVAGGGEAGQVGHLTAGNKSEGGGGGQAKELLEPGGGGDFHHGGCGRRGVEAAVLVPGGGEPIGSEGGGEGSADGPGKEAAASHAGEGVAGVGDEVGDDLLGWEGVGVEGLQEAVAEVGGCHGGGDGRGVERVEKVEGGVEGLGEQGAEVGGHGTSLCAMWVSGYPEVAGELGILGGAGKKS